MTQPATEAAPADPFLEQLSDLMHHHDEEINRIHAAYGKRLHGYDSLFRRLGKAAKAITSPSKNNIFYRLSWGDTVAADEVDNEQVEELTRHLLALVQKGEVFDAMMVKIKADDNLQSIWDQLCLTAKLQGD